MPLADPRRRFGRQVMYSCRRPRSAGRVHSQRSCQIIGVKMTVVITDRALYVVNYPVCAVRIRATVLDLKCATAAAASIETITRIVHVGIGVVEMDVQRRAAWMHIKAQRHRAVLHFTIHSHVGKPQMVASSLHLHSVAVEPVNLQMLYLQP